MPDRCAVCQSGRKGSDYSGSYHSLPTGDRRTALRELWLKAIPVELGNDKRPKLCELHFSDDDFQEIRNDSNASRNQSRGEMKKRCLKVDAVPHIWPELPAYFTTPSPPRRSDTSSAESRCEKENQLMQKKLLDDQENDRVSCIDDIRQKMKKPAIPGITEISDEHGNLIFASFVTTPVVKVRYSLLIRTDLSFQLTHTDVIIPHRKVSHVSPAPKIVYAAQVHALINFLSEYKTSTTVRDQYIQTACVLLEFAAEIENNEEYNDKLCFLIEQLNLLDKKPTGRRYSPHTLATCMMWYKTSPALYRLILSDNLTTFPSEAHLKRLSGALTVDLDFSDTTIAYLKARFSRLSDRDKVVALLLDEVKTNQGIEYIRGAFFRSTKDGVTKGLLGVMISSLGGRYRDMIAMIPVVTLKWEQMKKIYLKVLEGLTKIGFSTCATSVDGHRTNHRFYKEICGGEMKQVICNPYKNGEKICPLFDTTHIFKCIYNIFMTRQVLHCPAFGEFPECNPDFNHLKRLHELEFGKSPKIAYKLNDRNLASTPIERCNVGLADSISHESSIQGLIDLSADYPEFRTTATFLQIIRRWWNVVNVSNSTVGKRKLDPSRNAVSRENFENATFLRNFADWCENWQKCSKASDSSKGLTDETFSTLIHTSRTLPDLAEYLLNEKKFDYVLFRKAQSDNLEGGYGTRRQMHGGDYYAGTRQFMESEKTIRIKSLIKFCNFNMIEIKEIFKEQNEAQVKQIKNDANALLESIDIDIRLGVEVREDRGILFYVSGYIARCIKKSEKCVSCHHLAVSDDSPMTVSIEEIRKEDEHHKKQFFDVINRGGLCKPSDALYMTTVHAQELLDQVFKTSVLLQFKSPREVFAEFFHEKLSIWRETKSLVELKCDNGHHYSKLIKVVARKLFNIRGKNYANDENSRIHALRREKSEKRKANAKVPLKTQSSTKIAKLQSGRL